jgi:hypothetical protein
MNEFSIKDIPGAALPILLRIRTSSLNVSRFDDKITNLEILMTEEDFKRLYTTLRHNICLECLEELDGVNAASKLWESLSKKLQADDEAEADRLNLSARMTQHEDVDRIQAAEVGRLTLSILGLKNVTRGLDKGLSALAEDMCNVKSEQDRHEAGLDALHKRLGKLEDWERHMRGCEMKDTPQEIRDRIELLESAVFKAKCTHAAECAVGATPNCWNTQCRFHDAVKGQKK